METKRDILWRSYLIYLIMLLMGVFVFSKALYIQQVEGSYWKSVSDSLHLEYREMDAERGTIYSEDGRMLSSSIPFFDIYLDFGAEGIQEKNGTRFKKNVDSLSIQLSSILGEGTPAEYKRELMGVFARQERYHLLEKNIDFNQYRALRQLSFISKNKNKNGFIFVEKEKRLAPFGLLANRTIGLSRQYTDSDGNLISKNVGLEKTYDSLLRGITGKRLVRRIAGGAYVPVAGSEIEPENGKDLITTIDINIQDIAQQALLKVMEENECTSGTCIVMEVKTGKIKAIANLGRQSNGTYIEDLNHAILRSEPGSTFKLITLMSALDDQYINLETRVNIEGGKWDFSGRTVWDSERHSRTDVNYQQAFELSSNVGMAKLAVNYYYKNPQKFINHLKRLKLDGPTGIDIEGESKPIIPNPAGKNWSNVTLPWMSFGYNLAISPLQTLTVYNAVANGGKMMKPYLVNAIVQNGKVVKSYQPAVLVDSICSKKTLEQVHTSLVGVVNNGTAKSLQSSFFQLAGKTGTAQVANGNRGYTDHIYQASFAGYFPADNPKYSCIVVIKNKPFAAKYYGALVAGPVFKEIATKLFTIDAELYASYAHKKYADTSKSVWVGSQKDFNTISGQLNQKAYSVNASSEWTKLHVQNKNVQAEIIPISKTAMPDVIGFGLKDALDLLERQSLQVIVQGKGKVNQQSITPGTPVQKGQTIYLTLGKMIE